MNCAKFRELLKGDDLTNILDVLNEGLVSDELDSTMLTTILYEMCEHKDLEERIIQSIKKNGFQELKNYLVV